MSSSGSSNIAHNQQILEAVLETVKRYDVPTDENAKELSESQKKVEELANRMQATLNSAREDASQLEKEQRDLLSKLDTFRKQLEDAQK